MHPQGLPPPRAAAVLSPLSASPARAVSLGSVFWPLVCQPRPHLVQFQRCCWGLCISPAGRPPTPALKFSCLCCAVDCCCCLVPQSCPTLCHPMDHGLPGSSVHKILQARILEWVAISSSRGSSQPEHGTHVSCIGRRILGSTLTVLLMASSIRKTHLA